MTKQTAKRPIRVAVFDTIPQADRAVEGLLAHGFTKDQISVMCSDKVREQHFREFHTPDPAGAHTPEGIIAGGAIGAALGGLTLALGVVTTGGLAVIAAGAAMIGGGALVGSFAGAMMTRGFEKEIADYYDQAVTSGKILVAVEDHSEDNARRLAVAEQVFTDAGAEPVPLREG